MALTTAQTATLKAYILADPVLAPLTSGPTTDLVALQNALNADASPVQKAWRHLPANEVFAAMDSGEIDNITSGAKQWAIGTIMPAQGGINATTAAGRKAITDLFANASVPLTRAAVLAAATENASVAEVALGGSSASSASPNVVTALVRNWSGDLSLQDVREVLGL